DVAWADLARDTDGDGLTDLLEERIVTDPNAADTDGDGILDGRDPLPQVALTPGDALHALKRSRTQRATSRSALGQSSKASSTPRRRKTRASSAPAPLARTRS